MKKRKPTAAQRALATEWETMTKHHSSLSTLRRNTRQTGTTPPAMTVSEATRRAAIPQIAPAHQAATPEARQARTNRIFEGMKGSTSKSTQQYTGDKIIGIATMHKSNLVPIFNSEAAIDVATMRRN